MLRGWRKDTAPKVSLKKSGDFSSRRERQNHLNLTFHGRRSNGICPFAGRLRGTNCLSFMKFEYA